MLYEGALQAVQQALSAHRSGDILARGNSVTKAVQILGELRFSLRREIAPQYCDLLGGLYSYLQRRLIQAHAERSEAMLQESVSLLQTLLEGWIGAMGNVNTESDANSVAPNNNATGAAQPDRELVTVGAPAAPPDPWSPAASHAPTYSSYSSPAPPESQNRSWEF